MEVIAARRGFWLTIRESLAGGHRDYTEGPIGAAILLLAIPMVLELCLESVFAVVDVFFVVAARRRRGRDRRRSPSRCSSSSTRSRWGSASARRRPSPGGSARRTRDGAARAAVQAIVLGVLVAVPVGVLGVAYRAGRCCG